MLSAVIPSMPIGFLWGVSSGIGGLVAAWWIGMPLLCAFTLSQTLPRLGVSLWALLREIIPTALACAAMAMVVLALQRYTPLPYYWLDLAWNAFAGASVYAATLWIGWRPMVIETWDMLRNRRQQAGPPIPAQA